MIHKILSCALLLLPALAHSQTVGTTQAAGDLNYTVTAHWAMKAKPVAMVQSLDNKKVFILGDDAKVHIFTPQGKELAAMPVDANVTDIDIAPRGEAIYLLNGKDNSYTALAIDFTQHIDITGSPILGNPDAPVALVEFSDFECPYCSKVKPLLDQLLEKNKDTLKVVFKHMPLIRIHKQAIPAAKAAIAAQKQGKFWEMHDALFAAKKLTPEAIDKAAADIGLNIDQFNTDRNSPATQQQLNKDMADAKKADVTGTPTLFINGKLVQDRSPQGIQNLIDRELAASQAK